MDCSTLRRKWFKYLLVLFTAVIYGCGGGNGGGGDLASNGGGTGGTGISVGSISAIGSVHVNGVRYDTGKAEIFVDGQRKGFGDQAVVANLKVGMVVRVEGETLDAQNGTAQRVYFNDDIRGPVESIRKIDSTTTELTVLGQKIIIGNATNSDGFDLDSSHVGDWIQVSGFYEAEGRISATFIASSDRAANAKMKGRITDLDSTNHRFTINGIAIDYQNADLAGLNDLSDGQSVEVTGALSADQSTIMAERIEPVDLLGVANSQSVVLSGIVSDKVSNTRFQLNGVTVVVDAQTDYLKGDPEDLGSGVYVRADGKLVDGVLYADKIIFLDNVKVESNVVLNDMDRSKIALAGLEDVPIHYNELTKVTGAVSAAQDITSGHHVKIIGKQTQNEIIPIHIIVNENLNAKVNLQGPMESDPGPTISVLGHSIDLTSIPDNNFESPEGVSVDYATFLNLVSKGEVVTLHGELAGDQVVWRSIAAE